MIPYVTNRGGPLIGIEALALQGIPANELLLTRETEDQLADLAGNAMSSTVVGTCMVAAIILATDYFDGVGQANTGQADAQAGKADAHVVDAAIAELGDSVLNKVIGQDSLVAHDLDLVKIAKIPAKTIMDEAAKSSRYCLCEGPTGTAQATLICRACRHTRCTTCSNRPLHEYEPHPHSDERIDPRTFGSRLKSVLPMRVTVDGLTRNMLDQVKQGCFGALDAHRYSTWSDLAVASCQDTEFHFKSLDRKHQWHALYESQFARLDLTIDKDKAVWLLFAKVPATDNVNALRRQMAVQPIARMVVSPKADNLLRGQWAIQLPTLDVAKLDIKGKGELVPAWEAKIGLQQMTEQDLKGRMVDSVRWQDKQQWSEIEISYSSQTGEPTLDVDIAGTYRLHPNCGTAMDSLHIKQGSPDVSFFLDPVRVGFAANDAFVFALDHERLDYEQQRVVTAALDPVWRPMSTTALLTVNANISGTWVDTSAVSVSPLETSIGQATYAIPSQAPTVKAGPDACLHAEALLVCQVPLPHADGEPLWDSVKGVWGEIELQHKGKQAFDALAWITERLPPLESLKEWAQVPLGNLTAGDGTTCCDRCAPSPPELSWMMRQNRLVPVEDVVQAGKYERVSRAHTNTT